MDFHEQYDKYERKCERIFTAGATLIPFTLALCVGLWTSIGALILSRDAWVSILIFTVALFSIVTWMAAPNTVRRASTQGMESPWLVGIGVTMSVWSGICVAHAIISWPWVIAGAALFVVGLIANYAAACDGKVYGWDG